LTGDHWVELQKNTPLSRVLTIQKTTSNTLDRQGKSGLCEIQGHHGRNWHRVRWVNRAENKSRCKKKGRLPAPSIRLEPD